MPRRYTALTVTSVATLWSADSDDSNFVDSLYTWPCRTAIGLGLRCHCQRYNINNADVGIVTKL